MKKFLQRLRGWIRMIVDGKECYVRVGREWMALEEYGRRYQGGKP